MKRSIMGIAFFIIILCIAACSSKNFTVTENDGVKIVTNNGIPNNPELEVLLSELYTIQGFDENVDGSENSFGSMWRMQRDRFGNIYILDKDMIRIFKFDQTGELMTSFIKKGQGPGEMDILERFLIRNDSLFTFSHYRYLVYDLDGNYKYEKQWESNRLLKSLTDYRDGKIIVSLAMIESEGDDYMNDNYLTQYVQIMQPDFSASSEYFQKEKWSFNDVIYKDTDWGFYSNLQICSDGELIYIAKRDTDQYLVNVYDDTHDKIQEIRLSQRVTKYTPDELEYIKENLNNSFGGDRDFSAMYDKHVMLRNVMYDRNGDYLWVERPMDFIESTITFDLFRGGIYQNSFTFPVPAASYEPLLDGIRFKIFDNKLIYYNSEDNVALVFSINYNHSD